jgi:TfoX/Sxy family transcriptional regulator of competence genes
VAWKKSPPELVATFERLLAAHRAAERRSMFGYPAGFVGGNMFAGLQEDRFVLRLAEDDVAKAKQLGATAFEPMPGRAMRGWVVLPPQALADAALARRWIGRAFRHAAAMPPKRQRTTSRGKQGATTSSRPS